MKYLPSQNLKEFIHCYWIVKNATSFFKNTQLLTAYPGVTPEVVIPLTGSFSYKYKDKWVHTSMPTLFSLIEEKLVIDHTKLKAFILVQFKPLALFSLRQFVTVSSKEIMKKPICNADEIFITKIIELTSLKKNIPTPKIIEALDHFFIECLHQKPNVSIGHIIKTMKNGTKLKDIQVSYATLERYFKTETGLTPKKFQSLQRFKLVLQEIYETQNNDWIHYVDKYNYYDQSHFIKEIKYYTSFTPTQLCKTPALLNYRNISI